jgi:uncharacterized glyoxalase superfamily protein PhnB
MLLRLIPKIFYVDVEVGIDLFVRALAFEIVHRDDTLVVVARDNAKAYLVEDAEFAAKDRPEIAIETDTIDAVHADVRARAPDRLHPNLAAVARRPWGAREFAVRDESDVCVVFRQWESAATKNRSIPAAAVIPVLQVSDVAAAARWLTDAIGFRERLRIGDHRVQLVFGDGALVVAEASAPPTTSGDSIMLRVENLDAVFANALRFGATAERAPEDHAYGERQATLRTPFGHVFTLSQSIADVDPADWGGVVGDAGLD